jgi:hypothetical protein
MYGIIKQRNQFHVIPMECIKIGSDTVIATGIKNKATAKILSHKIYLKNQNKNKKQNKT